MSSLQTRMSRLVSGAAGALLLMGAALPSAMAKDVTVGSLKITAPWSRATPGGAKVAGGYLTIKNTGKTPDVLVGGTLDGAAHVEIHEMSVIDNIMKMRKLPKGLTIKPGQTVVLKPGGFHVMFMGMKRQLKKGEHVDGTLIFKTAGSVNVSYEVRALGAGTGGHAKGMKKMEQHHGKH
ncbi:MAG: copper chaperone PCu(A)C [Hyphomicrobiaceae bacterium]